MKLTPLSGFVGYALLRAQYAIFADFFHTLRELDLIARIATRLGGGVVEKTAESFLADVWAHPLDDAPRELFAAWRLQRGDPRGELITLQLERHPAEEGGARRRRRYRGRGAVGLERRARRGQL